MEQQIGNRASVPEMHGIPANMEELQKAAASLEDRIRLLVERLAPVLNQDPKALGKLAEVVCSTKLGQTIRDITEQLLGLRFIVEDVLLRLEL